MGIILVQPDAKGMADYRNARELMFKETGATSYRLTRQGNRMLSNPL